MIAGSILAIYGIICLVSGIIMWPKTAAKAVLLFFLLTHLLCCAAGLLIAIDSAFSFIVPLTVSLAWISRILNGRFVLRYVHPLHHLVTALFFAGIVILTYL